MHMLVSAELGGDPPDFTACVSQGLVLVLANLHQRPVSLHYPNAHRSEHTGFSFKTNLKILWGIYRIKPN